MLLEGLPAYSIVLHEGPGTQNAPAHVLTCGARVRIGMRTQQARQRRALAGVPGRAAETGARVLAAGWRGAMIGRDHIHRAAPKRWSDASHTRPRLATSTM